MHTCAGKEKTREILKAGYEEYLKLKMSGIINVGNFTFYKKISVGDNVEDETLLSDEPVVDSHGWRANAICGT